MTLNGTTTAIDPTAYGLTSRGDRHELVLTFGVAAVSLPATDLVKLSTTDVTSCTAVDDKVIGMAISAVDNSAGTTGDLDVGVVVKGIITQDALTAAATHTAIAVGTIMYLAPTVSSYCTAGQAVSISTAGSAVQVGRSLDVVTAPSSGSQISKIRLLVDFTSVVPAKAWV